VRLTIILYGHNYDNMCFISCAFAIVYPLGIYFVVVGSVGGFEVSLEVISS
jgi:hypothetical protein